MADKKIFTLSSLTRSIEKVINSYCNKTVWVKAEIVKLNYYPKSGHCFPTLVEKRNGKIVAELKGNLWSENYQLINNRFKSILKEELRDDMTVVIQGHVTFHPLYGLSLNILDIDPEYTLGELAREKAETIARLKQADLFNSNREKSLSLLPKTIAVISAQTSKGYGDFIDVIRNNSMGFNFHFLLFPAILQGERAVGTINMQLEKIKQHTEIFDAVAIIRGGGGEIGLSCFDDFHLSRKIATFPIPVLTGIGHSANETVSELVSHKSFITPTKVAEFLVKRFEDFADTVQLGEQKIWENAKRFLCSRKDNLHGTGRLFNSLTANAMNNSRAGLRQETDRLESLYQRLAVQQKNELLQTKRIIMNSGKLLEEENKNIRFLGEKIKMLSPENILKRGFSITRQNGKVIRDLKDLTKDQPLETSLFSGTVMSTIDKTKNKNKSNQDE